MGDQALLPDGRVWAAGATDKGGWNLRRVREDGRRPRVREVYYDDTGVPWGYCAPDIGSFLRFGLEAFRAPVLRHPEDFGGRAPT